MTKKADTSAIWLVTYSRDKDLTTEDIKAFNEASYRANGYITSVETGENGKVHAHAFLRFDRDVYRNQVANYYSRLGRDSQFTVQLKKAKDLGAAGYVMKDGSWDTNMAPEFIEEARKTYEKKAKKASHNQKGRDIALAFLDWMEERGTTGPFQRMTRIEAEERMADFLDSSPDMDGHNPTAVKQAIWHLQFSMGEFNRTR